MNGARIAKRAGWLLLLILVVVGVVLRVPALDRVPPGFGFDEAYNAIDALRVLQGDRIVVLLANGSDSLIMIAQNVLSGGTVVLLTHAGGKIAPLGYTKPDEILAGGAEPVKLFWQLLGDTDEDHSGLPDGGLSLDSSLGVTL